MADSQEQGGRSSIPSNYRYLNPLSPRPMGLKPLDSFRAARVQNNYTNSSNFLTV